MIAIAADADNRTDAGGHVLRPASGVQGGYRVRVHAPAQDGEWNFTESCSKPLRLVLYLVT